MKNYTVTPAFKTVVTEILSTLKFSTVFPYMNLVNREGFAYSEQELNSIIQFMGELPYSQVAEFFQGLPNHVSELEANAEERTTVEEDTANVKEEVNI